MTDTDIVSRPPVRLEAHRHAATLYFREVLSSRSVAQAMAMIEGLSLEVRALRADVRDVRLFDPEAFGQLARGLARWRSDHQGAVDVRFGERARRAPWQIAPAPADDCACLGA